MGRWVDERVEGKDGPMGEQVGGGMADGPMGEQADEMVIERKATPEQMPVGRMATGHSEPNLRDSPEPSGMDLTKVGNILTVAVGL